MEYIRMQAIARKTMNYIREIIRPGMSLPEVRRLCEEKMLELGAEKFWYYGIGAFVFSGEDTGISVSGRIYSRIMISNAPELVNDSFRWDEYISDVFHFDIVFLPLNYS